MKWIPVKERKPQLKAGPGSLCRNSGFLHVVQDGERDIAVLFENGQWLDGNLDPIYKVTHWAEGGVQLG